MCRDCHKMSEHATAFAAVFWIVCALSGSCLVFSNDVRRACDDGL